MIKNYEVLFWDKILGSSDPFKYKSLTDSFLDNEGWLPLALIWNWIMFILKGMSMNIELVNYL